MELNLDLLDKFGGLERNSLNHIINSENVNDTETDVYAHHLQQSHYFNTEQFISLTNKAKNNFAILSINT